MNKYNLLTSSSGNRGSVLFWPGLLLLAVAAADQFYRPFLGPLTMVIWGLGSVALLAAFLLRLQTSSQTGYVQIEPDMLIVRYGQRELRVGYDEIGIITGSRVSMHHSLQELRRRERQAVKPYFNQTHIFVALHGESEAVQKAKRRMPQFMFGTTQPGLLLLVEDDWLTVERAIDSARMAWLGQIKESHQEVVHRSLAAQLWDEDGDDEEDEEDGDFFSL